MTLQNSQITSNFKRNKRDVLRECVILILFKLYSVYSWCCCIFDHLCNIRFDIKWKVIKDTGNCIFQSTILRHFFVKNNKAQFWILLYCVISLPNCFHFYAKAQVQVSNSRNWNRNKPEGQGKTVASRVWNSEVTSHTAYLAIRPRKG